MLDTVGKSSSNHSLLNKERIYKIIYFFVRLKEEIDTFEMPLKCLMEQGSLRVR